MIIGGLSECFLGLLTYFVCGLVILFGFSWQSLLDDRKKRRFVYIFRLGPAFEKDGRLLVHMIWWVCLGGWKKVWAF